MSKLKIVVLLLLFSVWMVGCSNQPTDEENKINAVKMLSYVSEKYDLEFEAIEYIPGIVSFNDFMEENILIAKSEEGILANVKEKLGAKGEYYDNYLNFYASTLVDEKVDYSNIDHLVAAKTYASLKLESITYQELKEEGILSKEDVFRVYTFIQVQETANEETLKQLYDVYQQIVDLGFEKWSFIVSFSGDREKAKDYMSNYYLQTQNWEEYDPTISEVLRAYDEDYTFEAFKSKLTKVEE